MKVTIRLATNADGPRIGELVEAMLVSVNVGEIDWSDVYPHWLVAEADGRIVGALQISLGRPMGRIEMMSVERDLPKRVQANVVKGLMFQGLASLKQYGAQIVNGMVPFGRKGYRKILQKRGAVIGFSGHTMVWRL